MTTDCLDRPALECGCCGGPAIFADETGCFEEDSGGECISCGFPGHVEIEEVWEDDGEVLLHAYWSMHEDDESVAEWWRKHPERAREVEGA